MNTLSFRESEVLSLLVQGRKRESIAFSLGISTNTVIEHTKHIYQKLGVHSKIELASKFSQIAIRFHNKPIDGAIELRSLIRRGIRYISVNSRIVIASFLLVIMAGTFLEPQDQFCRVRSRVSSRSISRTKKD